MSFTGSSAAKLLFIGRTHNFLFIFLFFFFFFYVLQTPKAAAIPYYYIHFAIMCSSYSNKLECRVQSSQFCCVAHNRYANVNQEPSVRTRFVAMRCDVTRYVYCEPEFTV